jgi:ribosomal protein S17
MVVAALASAALAAGPSASVVAQATSPPAAKPAAKPKVGEAAVLTLRGTVEAIDKEKQTVTLKGPNRSLTIQVRDPKKLDAIKVGDPVVGKYYEALVLQVKKAGTASPGASVQQETATSKPGETPAGAVGERVTITATITAIDKAAKTVTIKGPEGRTETIKARDPKNLEAVAVGDLVEITYTRALAIALDKSAKK